jgi:hypothetical protein
MNRAILAVLMLAIVSLACLETTTTADPTPTAPPTGEYAGLSTPEGQPPAPTAEQASGAVFEIPEWWYWPASPEKPMLQKKGRSNYR